MPFSLWFGDERGYNATTNSNNTVHHELWFGDERGYNATIGQMQDIKHMLWFGDERGYNATLERGITVAKSCGLVMKEDITQL